MTAAVRHLSFASLLLAAATASAQLQTPQFQTIQYQTLPPQSAQSQPNHALVLAATDAAIANLKVQIDALPLGPNASIGQYLTATKSHDDMRFALSRAQLIGGPRLLDQNTLQVRLDISATAVAVTLNQIAAKKPKIAGFSPQEVAVWTRSWSDRTFTATGAASSASSSAATAVQIAPLTTAAANPQSTPSPEALAAARASAVQALIARLSTAQLPTGQSAKDLLASPGVSDALAQALAKAPVKSQSVTPAGETSITLALDAPAIVEIIRSTTNQDPALFGANRDALLPAVPPEITGIARPSLPTAVIPNAPTSTPPAPTALNTGTNPAPASSASVTFPIDTPPPWFYNTIDATGTSPHQGAKLLTARLAESEALKSLRTQLEALPLSSDLTLASAIKRDPRYAEPLSRALDRARVFKVDYLDDASASVKVSTDTRYLWQDIVALRLR